MIFLVILIDIYRVIIYIKHEKNVVEKTTATPLEDMYTSDEISEWILE